VSLTPKTVSVQDLLAQYEQGLDVTFLTTPQASSEHRLIFYYVRLQQVVQAGGWWRATSGNPRRRV
jgi:hypothetical protein